MPLSSFRWHVVTESSFPWEREALDFVRQMLPDQEPYRAWTNFEFIAGDGTINEVDLLVLAPGGFFLVEIKSRPGVLEGDTHTWTWRDQGREHLLDNPLFLANRKAKRLSALLKQQRAVGRSTRLPFLEPLIFCSAPGLKVRLDGTAATGVRVRGSDQPGDDDRLSHPGRIIKELTRPPSLDSAARIDANLARVIAGALNQAGIRPSQKARKVGDYELKTLLEEGPAYQDYEATHVAIANVIRRVRIYQTPRGATGELRDMINRAARREFQLLEGINHPSILRAVEFKEHERGPALVFDQPQDAERLDHFLQKRGTKLPLDERLDLLRHLAEAMKYAHEKKLVHRALSPQSVLVTSADSPKRRLQVFNWQVGAREGGATVGRSVTATSHVEQLIEEEAALYMAPEAMAAPGQTGEHLDVFSLGAIAYHVLSGVPPAQSVVELADKLREQRGLNLSAVMDGATETMERLVGEATCPDVSARLESVDQFIARLNDIEEELTLPDQPETPNPTEARAGDMLAGDLKVRGRLGQGSSSIVLLVERDGRELVLKVAASPEFNERLRQEADVLATLRHQHIVALIETLEIGGYVALLMERAGNATLAQRLTSEGPLHLELLQRFGEDLLQTVSWLEQKGIPHRDIKPENIGVAEVGASNRLHLVLFDFSLARTPLDAIRAGTAPYLDPFLSLRRVKRWDVAAERFAAAVTLYQMATTRLPVWGDGRSDPAMVDAEVTLESGLFDPDLREPMVAFFEKALRRDAAARFDNADEMLHAWRSVFAGAAQPRVEPTLGDGLDFADAAARATARTPLVQIGLSTRALNALERQQVHTAGELVLLASRRLYAMPGVGAKTRNEIIKAKDALRVRLAASVAPAPTRTTTATTDVEAQEAASIDLLMARLLPRGRATDTTEQRILARFLTPGGPDAADESWPTQSAVAPQVNVTRARVSQVLAAVRTRWGRNAALTRLRNDALELLQAQGGVMTVRELAQALLAMRGSEAAEPLRSVRALAVTRALVEAERTRDEPRFGDYRRNVVLVAINEEAADFADRLGDQADALAAADPLMPPARALEQLQTIPQPDINVGVSSSRLVQLAAAASRGAAVSSRMEFYPRGMDAERALGLAQSALLGARFLTVDDVRSRVAGRYPEAQPLPDRPELDSLLARLDLTLQWNTDAADGRGAYTPRIPTDAGISSSTTFRTRPAAADEGAGTPADVQRFEQRLQASLGKGAFLVLGVDPKHLQSAERRLAGRFDVSPLSLETLLINELKRKAAEGQVDWNVVRQADAEGPGGATWQNLTRLVGRAMPGVEEAVMQRGRPVLLSYPGLLARYGRLNLLTDLQARAGRPDGPSSAWVLVSVDGQHALPMVDGQALPVTGPAQWTRVPEAWIQDTA